MHFRQGLTHLLLLPISSKSPFDGQKAIEIPDKNRLVASAMRFLRKCDKLSCRFWRQDQRGSIEPDGAPDPGDSVQEIRAYK
jgi:hypothetical protein